MKGTSTLSAQKLDNFSAEHPSQSVFVYIHILCVCISVYVCKSSFFQFLLFGENVTSLTDVINTFKEAGSLTSNT